MYTTTKYMSAGKYQKTPIPNLNKTIRADVKFGTPSDDCRGLGICEVVPRTNWRYQDLNRSRCMQAKAYISLLDNGDLEFHFVRSTICELTFRRFFNRKTFLIKEGIEMPKTIANQFNLQGKRIEPGEYSIREFGELITVVFH